MNLSDDTFNEKMNQGFIHAMLAPYQRTMAKFDRTFQDYGRIWVLPHGIQFAIGVPDTQSEPYEEKAYIMVWLSPNGNQVIRMKISNDLEIEAEVVGFKVMGPAQIPLDEGFFKTVETAHVMMRAAQTYLRQEVVDFNLERLLRGKG